MNGNGSWTSEDNAAREALTRGAWILGGLMLVGSTLAWITTLPPGSVAISVGAFGLSLALILALMSGHHPWARFGAANTVTLVRAALVAVLLGFVGAGAQAELAWYAVGIATLAGSLDALDGFLARRLGTASAFGARFDLEVDAALVMVLSVLVWQSDQAGPWVLLAGLMRYLFALAGVVWPWLRAPLPPSVRRQGVCVVQVVALTVCLAPIVAVPWGSALAALALATLAGSFLIDVQWLARASGRALGGKHCVSH
jgi:phosphatidylglycerophosphate synthase